jgi:uncharacterized protein YjdB
MIFSKKKKILSAMLSLAMIGTMVASVPFTASADTTTATPAVGVSYSTQIQSIGWQAAVADGALSGTVGKAKRLEAIKINLTNAPKGASITYKTQVQSFGWQAAVSDGAVSGTVGKAKRLETIKITLSGMPGYSVKYQVQGQSYGWQAAVSTENGTAIDSAASAGTVGLAKRLEAIKITIVKDPVTTVSVASVTAATAQTLAVKFSGAVADTSKYTFKTVKGTTTLTDLSTSFTATWSADKTTATLSYNANMPADTYTVTAASTGTDLSTTSNSGSAVVTAQTVTKITIPSKSLIRYSLNSGTAGSPAWTYGASFSYKIYDQYGTDITSSISLSSLSINAVVGSKSYAYTSGGSAGTYGTITQPSTTAGTLQVNNGTSDYASTDTTGVISIVYGATGVNTSATVNLVAAASVASVTFGANILPTGYTTIQKGLSPAVTVPITVVDQYGNTVTDSTVLGASLQVISSDTTYAPKGDFAFTTDANGNAEITFATTDIGSAETIVLTLVNTTSGSSWSKSFNVVLAATPSKIAIGDFSNSIIAAGDSVALPMTITDQFGNTMTKAQIASNAALIKTWFTNTTFFNTADTWGVDTNPSSSTYGDFIGTVAGLGVATRTEVLVFNSYTSSNTAGNLVTKTVTVSDARIGNYVSNSATVNLMQGASQDTEFAFKDQYGAAISYGNVIDNPSKTVSPDYDDYAYTVALTKLSGDNGCVTLDSSKLPAGYSAAVMGTATGDTANYYGYTSADVSTAKDIKLLSNSAKTGSYKLTITLTDTTTSTTASSATQIINVVANNTTGLTYSVAAIPTIAGDTAHTASSLDAYAQKIAVSAVDASGNTYVVNPNDVLSATSSDTSIASTSTSADVNTGSFYVAGAQLSLKYSSDQSTTITVLVNTQDGIKTLTGTVKVGIAAPVINKVDVLTAALDNTTSGTYATSLQTSSISAYTEDLAYSFSNVLIKAGAVTTSFHAVGQDQYGVWSNLNTGITEPATANTATISVNSTNMAPVSEFSMATGTTLVAAHYAAGLTDGTINATVIAGSGSKQIAIVVAEDVGTAPAAPAYTINYAAGTTTQVIPTTVEYSTSAAFAGATVGTGVAIALTPGTDEYFRVKATSTTPVGLIQHLVVAAAPALGTITTAAQTATEAVLVGGTAIVTADGYEYTTDGTTWSALTTGKTFDLSVAGTLKVRKAATSTTFASALSGNLNT